MTIRAFRNFANQLRKPSSYYFPVITELKGITNLVIGSLQILVSQYMKYSKNHYYNSLSTRHVQIGTQAVQRGMLQFIPGFFVGLSAIYMEKSYNVTSIGQNYINNIYRKLGDG